MSEPDLTTERPDAGGLGSDAAALGYRDDDDPKKLSQQTKTTIEWIGVIVGALAVALLVKTFLFQAFYIPSESMEPTLDIGDRVLVNKLDDTPTRGEIIVFAHPDGVGDDGIKDLIKRVIGLPGETVEGRDGVLYIDGVRIDEPYLVDGVTTSSFGPVEIADGEIWVMGDNRQHSRDSRAFGPVDQTSIVGKAFVIIWPVGSAGGL